MFAINEVLIPALDVVGERFEKGVFFLPQLMASAEAAKAGFETIKKAVDASGQDTDVPKKGSIVVCTVYGDIHDIGKNIVRMLLENYGYNVIDLGRDVPPQVVADAVVKDHVLLCGLSALMTATVPAMAETIELLRKEAPWCKVVVGGAVLNPEYAKMVGADYYAKDATETARIAAAVLG
jgi:5-methyltetrahydrofolate--homocysteine methyltransferase